MSPYSIEQSILEGEMGVKQLFEFVKDNAEQMDSYTMEKNIFARLMSIGLSAMKGYFAEKGTGDIGDVVQLEDGGILKKEKRVLNKNYFSVFGKVEVPRTWYRVKGGKGIMPLDAQSNLPERTYSYLLQEWMDLFSIRDSFSESSVSLKKLLGLEISQSRFEVVNRESANSYDEFYENKELPIPESEGKIQVIGFDGKGVPIIKSEAAKIQPRLGKGEKRQKTKEAIVGVSYTTDPKVRTAEEVAENLVYPEQAREKREAEKAEGVKSPPIRAKNARRIASLERSKKEVMEEVITDAKNRDPDNQRPLVAVMDGALCLWTLLTSLLAKVNWVGILDIIHVSEYLWKVGNALHGEKTPEGKKWVYEHLLAILQGRVGRVIGGLRQIVSKRKLKASQRKALRDAISYFENHREWMCYDEYLEAGYPIGSGVVESTCGHTVKKRMEGTGRRWSIAGAESTLLLRSVYTSDDWDAYWEAHREQERKRLYNTIIPLLGYADEYFKKKAA
ncbi:MAG: ISKra4 family transposase [Desulfatiglandales bacterium]